MAISVDHGYDEETMDGIEKDQNDLELDVFEDDRSSANDFDSFEDVDDDDVIDDVSYSDGEADVRHKMKLFLFGVIVSIALFVVLAIGLIVYILQNKDAEIISLKDWTYMYLNGEIGEAGSKRSSTEQLIDICDGIDLQFRTVVAEAAGIPKMSNGSYEELRNNIATVLNEYGIRDSDGATLYADEITNKIKAVLQEKIAKQGGYVQAAEE